MTIHSTLPAVMLDEASAAARLARAIVEHAEFIDGQALTKPKSTTTDALNVAFSFNGVEAVPRIFASVDSKNQRITDKLSGRDIRRMTSTIACWLGAASVLNAEQLATFAYAQVTHEITVQ
jgi:hypothetical protein